MGCGCVLPSCAGNILWIKSDHSEDWEVQASGRGEG